MSDPTANKSYLAWLDLGSPRVHPDIPGSIMWEATDETVWVRKDLAALVGMSDKAIHTRGPWLFGRELVYPLAERLLGLTGDPRAFGGWHQLVAHAGWLHWLQLWDGKCVRANPFAKGVISVVETWPTLRDIPYPKGTVGAIWGPEMVLNREGMVQQFPGYRTVEVFRGMARLEASGGRSTWVDLGSRVIPGHLVGA